MQIFGQKLRHVLEARDIFRIHRHQGLMRFEAGARDLFVVGIDGFRRAGLHVIRQFELAGRGRLEQVQRAEIFQQFGDARIGVQQFDAALGAAAPSEFNFRPNPASTPRNVLSISTQSGRSMMKCA